MQMTFLDEKHKIPPIGGILSSLGIILLGINQIKMKFYLAIHRVKSLAVCDGCTELVEGSAIYFTTTQRNDVPVRWRDIKRHLKN